MMYLNHIIDRCWNENVNSVVSSRHNISSGSLSQSLIIQTFRSITAVLCRDSAYFYTKVLSPSSCLCMIKLPSKGSVQEGQILRSRRHVKVVHEVISSKDYVFHGAATMVVDLSKYGSISGKKYEEPLGDAVSVCGFENALSAGQLFDFGDAVGLVLECIE